MSEMLEFLIRLLVSRMSWSMRQERRPVFLLGAGCSIQYGLPDFHTLLSDLWRDYFAEEPDPSWGTEFLRDKLDKYWQASGPTQRRAALSRYLAVARGENCPGYVKLASLAKQGYISAFVNLNFDTLLEEALYAQRVDFWVSNTFKAWSPDHLTIFKPYGSLGPANSGRENDLILDLASSENLAKPDEQLAMIELLTSSDVVILGHSGSDIRITAALRSSPSQKDPRDSKIFYANVTRPDPRLLRIMAERASQDLFAIGEEAGFERFMEELLETLRHVESTRGQRDEPVATPSPAPTKLGQAAVRGEASRNERSLPGFAGDSADGIDFLDVEADVNALCSVILARSCRPPLAVGLFGGWGTGKSFFMRRMQERINLLTELSRAEEQRETAVAFCSRVAQITFNAWHYLDTNLWASIVSVIFERLEDFGEPGGGPERFLQDFPSLQESLIRAKGAREEAEGDLQREKQRRTKLEGELKKQEARLNELRSTSLAGIAEFLESFGLSAILGQDIADLSRNLHSVSKRLKALWGALWRPNRRFQILLVGAALVIPALLAWGVHQLTFGHSSLLRQLASGLSAIALLALEVLAWVQPKLKALEQASHRADLALRPSVWESEQPQKVLGEIEEIRAQVADSERRSKEAQVRSSEAEAKMQEIERGPSLQTFLRDRLSRAEYRNQGMVSLVRRDLEWLSQRFAHEGEASPERRIERIILYIDDLDRCPASSVVQVLETVHLLLTFPLFVVVVGVDPRWLKRALEKYYAELLSDTPDPAESSSALSLLFLEKIFQIPFSLPPMNKKGFGQLIDGVLAESELSLLSTGRPVRAERRFPDIEAEERGGGSTESHSETFNTAAPAAIKFNPRPPSLLLGEKEVTFIRGLAPFISSPRSAKRLLNTYRIIRAGLDTESLVAFAGEEGRLGEYQAVLLLLALLIGYPGVAPGLFGRLARMRNDEGWWESFVAGIANSGSSNSQVLEEVHENIVALQGGLLADVSVYQKWVPVVARFSFEPVLRPRDVAERSMGA
jgi:hypothetical protein